MTESATLLLTTLHKELSGIGGYIAVAPKYASYPICTYNILNSRQGRVKSFTTDSNTFTVQFSYFSDASLVSCMSLATSAETILNSLSAFFDIDNGKITTFGNIENVNFYQLIDTREIEIIKEVEALPPIPSITYDFLGFVDGDLSKETNYYPTEIVTSRDIVNFKSSFYKTLPSTGTLTCSTFNFAHDDQTTTIIYLDLASGIVVNGNVVFTSERFFATNSTTLTNATFNSRTINNGTVTNAIFIPQDIGGWMYPANNGTVTNAICYWNEGDYTLGGTITNPITYMGYPV